MIIKPVATHFTHFKLVLFLLADYFFCNYKHLFLEISKKQKINLFIFKIFSLAQISGRINKYPAITNATWMHF